MTSSPDAMPFCSGWPGPASALSKCLFPRALGLVEEGAAPDADVAVLVTPAGFGTHLLAQAHALLLGALHAHALGVLLRSAGRISWDNVSVPLRVGIRRVLVDDSVV